MLKTKPICWIVLLLALTSPLCVQADQPNIVFILTDDQRYDEMGFLNPILQTPNIDALAAEGVHFSNAFVTTSLCSPSRASILTGQMMHNHGVVDNNRPLPEGLELFPARLQGAGYQTAFIGKWHMGGSSSEPRPEFDYWASFPGQGTYYPQNAFGGVTMLNVNGKQVAQQGYITDELTDYLVDFLENRDTAKPFFAYLSHKAVHAMFEPAERHRDQYSDADIKLGKPPAADADVPLWVLNQRNSWHGSEFPYHSELPLEEFKRQYHRTLTAVDDSIGRVRQWLEDNALADNTVVILMGDNGFMFGEHGLIDKRNAYEESMRVPLLVAAPGRFTAGQQIEQMVANIDIAPTILSLAGLAPPSHYDGMSFAELPTTTEKQSNPRQQTPWRDALTYEYYWEFNYPQTPTVFAIRTDRYKYVQYHGVWDTEELFDLASDPGEETNLIEDPDLLAVKVELRQQLYASLTDRQGRNTVPYTQKYNQGAVFRHADRSEAAEYPGKWLRRKGADDRWEHIIPDGPAKADRLKIVNEALKER
ncbi:MAG: sulfatase [Pseudomonadales bacterium]|jgi:arylsulfatase A-like enzyme|nr:sulfatase [Pseudomonadales bacterium]